MDAWRVFSEENWGQAHPNQRVSGREPQDNAILPDRTHSETLKGSSLQQQIGKKAAGKRRLGGESKQQVKNIAEFVSQLQKDVAQEPNFRLRPHLPLKPRLSTINLVRVCVPSPLPPQQ